MALVYHITTRAAWERSREVGKYRSQSLESDGYIHCSNPGQVVEVGNYNFMGKSGLVLLCIDTDLLDSEVRFEGSEDGQIYPHIYGPLNIEAVELVIDFEPNEDGEFQLPEGVL